jgi:serine/threonine protein kinase
MTVEEGDVLRRMFRDAPVTPLSFGAAMRARDVASRLAQAAADEPPLVEGELLGDYEVVKPLGTGGQGTVYLAQHAIMGWLCAIKVPRRAVAHRLLKEAQMAAPLSHPHVVQVRDVRIEVQRPFLVLEYCAGGCLAERIAAGEFADARKGLERARDVADGILQALAYAHAHGVVHRDIKPVNVLFDDHGRVKVCDFGIGRFANGGKISEERPALTDSALDRLGGPEPSLTRFAGTPRYMAPEQEDPSLRVDGKIDGRADIFALGKVLYEMLTSVPPRTVRPVSRSRAGIPEVWDDFIFRCVEERPQDRFPDALAALAALRTLPIRPSKEEATRLAARAARQAALDVPFEDGTRPPLWIPSLNHDQAVERAKRDGVDPASAAAGAPDPHVIRLERIGDPGDAAGREGAVKKLIRWIRRRPS